MPVNLNYQPTTELMSPIQTLTLKDLAQRSQLNQQEIGNRNAISQILQSPGAVQGGQINPQALNAVIQRDPQMGLKLGQMQEQIRLRDLVMSEKKTARAMEVEKTYVEAYDKYLTETNGNKAEARMRATADRNAAIDEAEKSGEASQLGFNEQDINRFRSSVKDPDQTRAILAGRGIQVGMTPYQKEEIRLKQEALDFRKGEGGTATKVAPSGYRWGKSGNLEFIPGGPADPDKKTGSLGNRESVFISRVMLSANEAAKDLANVVRLPTTASRGVFGGRQQGPSLFDASKETLANQMTTQEVQSYNTLSAGFQRSLAAIESAGLAPSGTLSHQMDAVIFKEGDTNFTKLQKLAQTRQIVEAGLETTLSNPKLAKQQKDHIEEVLTSIKKSVPFTQSELIELQDRQQINPNTTLSDIMKSKGAKSKYEYGDSEKEKRYQEWKKSHGG